MDSQALPLNNGMIDLWRAKVVRSDGTEEELTHLEAGLIRYLAQRSGTPVPRQELLAEVWGYGKSVRTRAVDATVKRLRHKIERDPSRPEHLRSAHGVGYAFFPAAAAAAPPQPTGVPAGGALLDAVSRHRLVTVIGPISVGKSHLAQQVSGRLGGRVANVDLTALKDGADITSAMRAQAHAGPSDDRHWLTALGPITIVLDNADADDVRGVVRDALSSAPKARFLITRRRALDLPEEQVVVVSPLSIEEGTDLFISEVRRLGRDIADRNAVEDIVTSLDGLPGFIRLAARRTAVQSETELAEAVTTSDTWVVTDQTPVPVQRAFRRLGDSPVRAIQALGCFSGSFGLPAAAAVTGYTLDKALATLERLIAGQWVSANTGTPTQYRLLRVARVLVDPPEQATRERFIDWVVQQLPSGASSRSDRVQAAAWAHGAKRLQLAMSIDDLDTETGLAADRISRLERHLSQADDTTAADRLPVVRRIAQLTGVRGDHQRATTWFEQARELAREAGSSFDVAETSISLASAYRLTGFPDKARTSALEGLQLATEHGNSRAIGVAAWSLGTLARADDDMREARRWFLRAIESGTARGRGMALESLAILIRRDGHTVAQPEHFFKQAVSELMHAGDPAASAHASGNLGCLYVDAERLGDARGAFDYALTTGRKLGLTASVAFGTAGIALCDALQGRRMAESDPPPFASPLAKVCHHIAQAIEARTAGHTSKVVGELAMAEQHSAESTRCAFRLARAVASAEFAPELALELVEEPAEGPLFAVLQPVARALVLGEPADAAIASAQSSLRGPDRAVLGATTLDLITRGIRRT